MTEALQNDYQRLLEALTEAYGEPGLDLLMGFETTFTEPNGWITVDYLEALSKDPAKVYQVYEKTEQLMEKEEAEVAMQVFAKVFTVWLTVRLRRSANDLRRTDYTGQS